MWWSGGVTCFFRCHEQTNTTSTYHIFDGKHANVQWIPRISPSSLPPTPPMISHLRHTTRSRSSPPLRKYSSVRPNGWTAGHAAVFFRPTGVRLVSAASKRDFWRQCKRHFGGLNNKSNPWNTIRKKRVDAFVAVRFLYPAFTPHYPGVSFG